MTGSDLFAEPADTREAIVKATYDARCNHGYANLTAQRIGDEFTTSKSLVYHHSDGKDEQLLDFLAYLPEHFETSVPHREYDDAAARLDAVLEHVLPDELDEDRRTFARTMVELRAQAAHDPADREHFTRSTRFLHERLVAIIERGIDERVSREVDPDRVAALLLATIDGARLQRVTADGEGAIPAIGDELRSYIQAARLRDPEAWG